MNRTFSIIRTITVTAFIAFAVSSCAGIAASSDGTITSVTEGSASVEQVETVSELVSGSPQDPNRADGIVVIDGSVVTCSELLMGEFTTPCDTSNLEIFEAWAPMSYDIASTLKLDPAASQALRDAPVADVAAATLLAYVYDMGLRGDPSGQAIELEQYGLTEGDVQLLTVVTRDWVMTG